MSVRRRAGRVRNAVKRRGRNRAVMSDMPKAGRKMRGRQGTPGRVGIQPIAPSLPAPKLPGVRPADPVVGKPVPAPPPGSNPPMPGTEKPKPPGVFRKGGAVGGAKKKSKAKVRGAGIARKGVRPAKMR